MTDNQSRNEQSESDLHAFFNRIALEFLFHKMFFSLHETELPQGTAAAYIDNSGGPKLIKSDEATSRTAPQQHSIESAVQ
jgi:hypothetical protein